MTLSQRNRFFEGDEIEIMQPGKSYITITAEDMRDEKGQPITVAPHAQQIVSMKAPEEICVGAMLRKKRV
jgi:putative protease